ncbi:hypothetical protein MARPO_0051s0115 [Marchantia polymorpha]|uniref:non-specific serine/threonine protein kinase n=1 Tax=Marchantia polymorpha TaxID=3197 RepID=A0A2R6WXD9_MARPO|nr:hypothetical protein MARPO_0051s0115 [Marchantia polymorpha]|eukprot:PTQ38518.1 hypothetical protein MARPO_0051s0115 [Marchantia polymorpha]
MSTCKAISWRTSVMLCTVLVLATIQPKVSADLASETAVLLNIKHNLWNNPPQFSNWRNVTPTCEWIGVVCDDQNTTITSLDTLSIVIDAPIPETIANLTNLTFIYFSGSNLLGEIPPSIGSLKKFRSLDLSSNGLNGSIPAELGDLTSLTNLQLGQNNLSGTLPDLSRLQSLQFINLGPNNYLSGPVPSWIGDLSQLEDIDIKITNFSGSLPSEIGKLKNLRSLNAGASSLSGFLPPELGNLTSLQSIQLNDNKLTGSIPDLFKNLRNLTSLVLANNRLNGSLGSWFGNLQSLEQLDLDTNSIEGPIPPELGSLLNFTLIVLSKNDLSGEIPDSLGNLTKLLTLSLDDNFLTGDIPANIFSLPELVILKLDNNCLNGTTPPTLNNSGTIESTYTGNCFSDSNTSQSCKCAATSLAPVPLQVNGGGTSNNNTTIYVSVGVVVGTLLVLGILFFILLRCRKRPEEKTPHKGAVKRFKLSEIKEATKEFTTIIGSGGQATVYRAEFPSDESKSGSLVVAVKRFGFGHKRKNRAEKTFDQEVGLLARLNHRCLVNVKGYCVESGEYILLVEYMDRGSLYDHLHGEVNKQSVVISKEPPLTWEERVNIAVSVAVGIDYLHYGCSPPVYHRDIKTANILLSFEQQVIAKVADFGLSKLTSIEFSESDEDFNTGAPKAEATQVQGSHGYIDPEFRKTCVYTEKSDIYSYGVVLLELITAKKASDQKNKIFLTDWATPYLDEPRDLLPFVDPSLNDKFDEEELIAMAELARRCIDLSPTNRPTVKDILETLRTVFKKQTTMISTGQTNIASTMSISTMRSNSSLDFPDHTHSINSYGRSEILPRE